VKTLNILQSSHVTQSFHALIEFLRRTAKTKRAAIAYVTQDLPLSVAAGLGAAANCHSFRATGITAYLLNGGTIEKAQAIEAHESPRITKLYDRISDEITLDEVERIGI
jgi:integrase